MTPAVTRRIEWLFIGLLALGLIWVISYFWRFGYLPQPYLPNPGDTLMDGYNTAWWASEGHVYDVWRAVYPPLSFVILRFIALPQCQGMDPFPLRDCDWSVSLTLAIFFTLNAILAFRAFRMTDRTTAWPRTIAFTLGLPMLFALDRGQMLIISTTAFLIAFGPGFASARMRMVAAAVAVNFKPYLIAPLMGQLLRGRWRWVEGALLCTLLLWLASAVVFGEGDPISLIDNLVNFTANAGRSNSWTFASSATSYNTIIDFLRSDSPMAMRGAPWALSIAAMKFALLITQLLSLAIFAAIWFRRHPVSRSRIALLFYALAMMTTEVGAYAEGGLIFLIFLERWQGPARGIAIACAYMLCLSFDITIAPGSFPHGRLIEGYLAGHPVNTLIDMNLGAFVRPGLILMLQIATIAQIWSEMRIAKAAGPMPRGIPG